MKLRLHGTPDEVAAVTRRLLQVLEVASVSAPNPDRGASRLVRIYLEIRLPPGRAASAPAASSGPIAPAKGRRRP